MSKLQVKPLETFDTPAGVKLVRGSRVITIAPDEFETVKGAIDRHIFRRSAYEAHGFPYDDPRVKGGAK